MATKLAQGIVLKTLDWDEYDQIVTILTAKQTIAVIARGVRKLSSKNRIALARGNIINFEFFPARLNNKLSKLKKATLIWQPPLEKADTALVLLEIINKIAHVETNVSLLFQAYQEAVPFFGQKYNHHIKVYILTRLLAVHGIWPIWTKCVECNRQDRISGFEFYQGGFTCFWHTKNQRPIAQLKAFQALGSAFNDYKDVDPEINFYFFQELNAFLTSLA